MAYLSFSHSCCYNFKNSISNTFIIQRPSTKCYSYSRSRIQAMTVARDGQPEAAPDQEPPSVNFAFVSSRPLLNCAGGGTCATCMVEVIEGKELLSTRTDKEKEKLKRNPKNWRLACQTAVGTPVSTGLVVIQQFTRMERARMDTWKGTTSRDSVLRVLNM